MALGALQYYSLFFYTEYSIYGIQVDAFLMPFDDFSLCVPNGLLGNEKHIFWHYKKNGDPRKLQIF